MTKILVVDDNNTMRVLLAQQLHALGWQTQTVSSADEAIEAFESGGIDLVVMDIHMPRVDGLEAVRLMRQLEQRRGSNRTPIIGLTGGISCDLRECLAAGMDDLMHKPAMLADLTSRIRPWLKTDAGPQG